jgi:hypothetical protein
VMGNVRIALGVIRKRDALQDSLPAIGGVERGKRSDELIEKRRLGSQKHCRRGRHLAALEPKKSPCWIVEISSWFGLW